MASSDPIMKFLLSAIKKAHPRAIIPDDKPLEEVQLGADIGFRSLDMIRLATLLNKKYSAQRLVFQKLFMNPDGTFAQDVSLGRLHSFLHEATP